MSDSPADAENELSRNPRPDNGPLSSFDRVLKCLTPYLWIRMILPSACGSHDATVNAALIYKEIVGFCLLNAELAVPKNLLQRLQNRLSQFKTADMTQRVLAMIKGQDAVDPQVCANAVNRMLPAQNLLGIVVSAEDVTHSRFPDTPSARRTTKSTGTENARRGTYDDKHALLAFTIARHYVPVSTLRNILSHFGFPLRRSCGDMLAADTSFMGAAQQCCEIYLSAPSICEETTTQENDHPVVDSDGSEPSSALVGRPLGDTISPRDVISQQTDSRKCSQRESELEERHEADCDPEYDVSHGPVPCAHEVNARVIADVPDFYVQNVTDHADNEIFLARHHVEEHEEDLVGVNAVPQDCDVPIYEETTDDHTADGPDLRVSEYKAALLPSHPLGDATSNAFFQQIGSRKRSLSKAELEERRLAYLDCEHYAEQRMNAPEYWEGEFHIASVPRTKLTYHNPPSTMTTPCQTQLVTYPVTHTRIPSVCE